VKIKDANDKNIFFEEYIATKATGNRKNLLLAKNPPRMPMPIATRVAFIFLLDKINNIKKPKKRDNIISRFPLSNPRPA
jgi:hypothetical protein